MSKEDGVFFDGINEVPQPAYMIMANAYIDKSEECIEKLQGILKGVPNSEYEITEDTRFIEMHIRIFELIQQRYSTVTSLKTFQEAAQAINVNNIPTTRSTNIDHNKLTAAISNEVTSVMSEFNNYISEKAKSLTQ